VRDLALVLTVFLACAVEAVEALTIVLAAGTGRRWDSALQGAAAGVLALIATVAALGPALSRIPLHALRLGVGVVLLLFGLQWLRKAVLRASGRKALRDETAAYERTVAAGREAPAGGRGAVRDWYAFSLSFKGVFVEGAEVAFIVLTIGGSGHSIPLAALGALAAVVAVTALGFAVRAPLARVPENTLKYAVAVVLTAFGIFWIGGGAGAHWPGEDAALLYLIPAVLAPALGATAVLRRTAPAT
jgi:uncharacterized membrane protein